VTGRFHHRIARSISWLFAVALMLAAQGAFAAGQNASPEFPVASEARVAGDAKQTRFILDLDRKISVSAFALADPYRVVLDIPQVTFRLAKGTGSEGRGLIKAFRYGLVMAGGSRIVFDLTGPARAPCNRVRGCRSHRLFASTRG
jgi:N-acetylmuramoyl-L-alanine amidase